MLLAAYFFGCGASYGVLVYNGTEANRSAPADDPGWSAVGTISAPAGPATAVFLGNNAAAAWFLTASHVSLAGATLSIGGNSYTVFSSASQISTADLMVFCVDSTLAGISPVTLSSSVPDINAQLTMLGNGKTGTKVTWDTANNPWTSPGSGAEGYVWTDPNVKQWGTNTVLARNLTLGTSTVLATAFDAADGEAQGSLGDSGGAVFNKNGTQWELAALIVAVGRIECGILYGANFAGQPGSTSVADITGLPNDKSVTYSVQIANYKSAILSAIPEPDPLALLLAFSPILVFVSAKRSAPRTRL